MLLILLLRMVQCLLVSLRTMLLRQKVILNHSYRFQRVLNSIGFSMEILHREVLLAPRGGIQSNQRASIIRQPMIVDDC